MALSQQMSLRLSDAHRDLIRGMLESLRRESPDPEKVTEADAVRALIEEAGRQPVSLQEAGVRE